MMMMYLYSKIRKCDTIIGDVGFFPQIRTYGATICGEACTYLQSNLCTCTVICLHSKICTGDVYVYTAIYESPW